MFPPLFDIIFAYHFQPYDPTQPLASAQHIHSHYFKYAVHMICNNLNCQYIDYVIEVLVEI